MGVIHMPHIFVCSNTFRYPCMFGCPHLHMICRYPLETYRYTGEHRGHTDVWEVFGHMGASKHIGGIQMSRGCPNMWVCTNIWGASEHMGLSKCMGYTNIWGHRDTSKADNPPCLSLICALNTPIYNNP